MSTSRLIEVWRLQESEMEERGNMRQAQLDGSLTHYLILPSQIQTWKFYRELEKH